MWAACRLAPWAYQGGELLPDGSGDPRVVTDFYAWTDIGVGTTPQNFSITTLPTLPFAATLKAGGANLTITGSNMVTGTPTIGSGGMYNYTGAVNKPIPINATKASTTSSWADRWDVDSSKHYIKANRARITSMGWRVVYTGPASTCAGILTCTSAPIRDDPIVDKTGSNNINFKLPDGTVGGVAITAGRLVPIDHIGLGEATKARTQFQPDQSQLCMASVVIPRPFMAGRKCMIKPYSLSTRQMATTNWPEPMTLSLA